MTHHLPVSIPEGSIIAMIGDSITSHGSWWIAVREQLLATRPGSRCDFRNCGVAGGRADGAVRRYDWDIAPHRATMAVVMFGMNDVGRDDYAGSTIDAERLRLRAHSLDQYAESMATLVGRLQRDGVAVILATPTPYDQYATGLPTPNLNGVDDALAMCGGIVRGIAAVLRLPVIDLHTPLRQRCMAGERLIGDDRVHPEDLGHAAMAELARAVLVPGPRQSVPPAVRAASQALHAAESKQRTIAMIRSWTEYPSGDASDAAVIRHLDHHQATESNLWVREQHEQCRLYLSKQQELAAEVATLRQALLAAT